MKKEIRVFIPYQWIGPIHYRSPDWWGRPNCVSSESSIHHISCLCLFNSFSPHHDTCRLWIVCNDYLCAYSVVFFSSCYCGWTLQVSPSPKRSVSLLVCIILFQYFCLDSILCLGRSLYHLVDFCLQRWIKPVGEYRYVLSNPFLRNFNFSHAKDEPLGAWGNKSKGLANLKYLYFWEYILTTIISQVD